MSQYRAICKHDGGTIWRGPVRNSYAEAEHDRAEHAKTCPYTDNGVIQPGDPGWD